MLVPVLVAAIIVLGVIVSYLYYFAPRLNPLNKADNLLQTDRIDEAIVEYRKVLEKKPFDISVLTRLADLYLKQNKIDQAVQYLEKITEANRYGAEAEKIDIFKLLAKLYLKRGEKDRAFSRYYEILKEYPSDIESLFHTGFIALGQEAFDVAFRNLEMLTRLGERNFKTLFGAGIAALQNQRTTEAVVLFKDALSMEPHSDITNIAMVFALNRKRDYKTSANYAKMVIENSEDETAIFIAKRLLAFIYIEAKKASLAVKIFEELKNYCITNSLDEELNAVLYDVGFACLLDDKTEHTYEYWSQLYQQDRNFRNIQDLLTRLRKEMDERGGSKFESSQSVLSEIDGWKKNPFPENFIWNICGLKSSDEFDIQSIISSGKTPSGREKKNSGEQQDSGESGGPLESLELIYKLDSETFRSVVYRLCEKLGLVIDEILTTYRENDGVDFMAHSKDTKSKTLVWVRRWKGTNIGEIPLRNFAQAINDSKAKQGYFITTTDLSDAGEKALPNLSKVTVIYPDEVVKLTKGLL